MCILDLNPPDTRISAFQATDWHMSGNQQGILGESRPCEGLAAGKISFRIGPRDHPARMLDFDCMVIEVTEAVKCHTIHVDTHNLVPGGFARSGDDAHL